MKLLFLLSAFCSVAFGQGDGLSVYSPTNSVRYLDDLNAGYTRTDYAWFLKNTQQPSYCFQNGQIIPSLTETGNSDAGIVDGWTIQNNGNGVTVAVVDSGVNTNSPDLSGVVLKGKRFWNRSFIVDDDYSDWLNHGTGVASVIAAKRGDGPMVGVAPGVKLLAVSTLYATAEIAQGIVWSVDNQANAICLSWGDCELTDPSVQALYTACIYARDNNVVICGAVGYGRNLNANPTAMYSWGMPNFIPVAGTARDGTLWPPSSFGSKCIGAPGRIIVQLGRDGLPGYSSGTSFASPIVCGVAALLKAHRPEASAAQIVSWVNEGTTPVQGIYGAANAEASLRLAQRAPSGPKFKRYVAPEL